MVLGLEEAAVRSVTGPSREGSGTLDSTSKRRTHAIETVTATQRHGTRDRGRRALEIDTSVRLDEPISGTPARSGNMDSRATGALEPARSPGYLAWTVAASRWAT